MNFVTHLATCMMHTCSNVQQFLVMNLNCLLDCTICIDIDSRLVQLQFDIVKDFYNCTSCN